MGTMKQGSWTYTITPEDKLWAARMIQGEGPVEDSAAVLWTMTQLFSPDGQRKKYSGPHHFRTFTDLIQAYSQPINPIWLSTGRKCRTGGSASRTEACSSVRLRRREVMASLPYHRVDAAKRQVIERWIAGSLPNPVPGAYEFAHVSVVPQSTRNRLGVTMRSSAGNIFLGSRNPVDRVIMGGGVGLLLVVGLVGAAWIAGRWVRRRRRAR